MNEKELICRALMGDKQAQEECTEKGIVLPCPFCGNELRERKTRKWTAAKNESIDRTIVEHKAKTGCYLDNWAMDKELELAKWNTRPDPPIGRCGECRNWNEGDCYRQELTKSTDYCSYFEPRERLL